jgi:hypothetical protein
MCEEEYQKIKDEIHDISEDIGYILIQAVKINDRINNLFNKLADEIKKNKEGK